MTCRAIEPLLSDYLEGALPAPERLRVERHLEGCAECRAALEELRRLVGEAALLPGAAEPPRDLWPGIAARLDRPARTPARVDRPARPGAAARPLRSLLPAAVVVLAAACAGVLWLLLTPAATGWEVARLAGTPVVDRAPLGAEGLLPVGSWLETDARSRARIRVGEIGQVEVEPRSRLRRVRAGAAEHRLALERGVLHARILAPPRLFIVDTPSATAIDLGCAYTLSVDREGAGELYVTSGLVELAHGARSSLVPAGARCRMRPGTGPGAPFFEDASLRFRASLARYEAAPGDAAALRALIEEARPYDTLTLWHLLARVDEPARAQLFDRIRALVPILEAPDRDGILTLDPGALDDLRDELELHWMREEAL